MSCQVIPCHTMSHHTIPYNIIPHQITLLTYNAVLQRIVRTTLTWCTPRSSQRHCCHPAVSIVLDTARALPARQTILCTFMCVYVHVCGCTCLCERLFMFMYMSVNKCMYMLKTFECLHRYDLINRTIIFVILWSVVCWIGG